MGQYAMDLNAAECNSLRQKALNLPYTPQEGKLLVGRLCVMCSAAGYYIGRPCIEAMRVRGGNHVEWLEQPYNRETEWYFPTREEAQKYLTQHTLNGEWK